MKRCGRKIVGMAFVFCFAFLLAGCGAQNIKLTATSTDMGTVVQKTIYVDNEKKGKEALAEIEAQVQNLEKDVLSWRIEDSQLAKINTKAGNREGITLSKELQEYLLLIWELSGKSGGALDVTVGKVTEVWNLDKWAAEEGAEQEFKVPETAVIQELLEYTGYEKVTFSEEHIYLPAQMKLDLGAVGKGIVCDKIGEYLDGQDGISGAVITVGGSVLTYGEKPDGSPWQVAIAHPREDGQYLGTLSLEGEHYIATSGDYERYVEQNGVRYHHIMDPETGYPADSDVCSVTIVSDSGLVSDALSTACFVLGVEQGMALAEEVGAQALFVTKDLNIYMTEGMKHYFIPNK